MNYCTPECSGLRACSVYDGVVIATPPSLTQRVSFDRPAWGLKPVRLLAAVAGGLIVLPGCSFDPEPVPDPTLMLLAHTALADADAFSGTDPDFSVLRQQQGSELVDEVRRLCGYELHGDGDDAQKVVPPSCDVTVDSVREQGENTPGVKVEGSAGEVARDRASELTGVVAALPESSMGLIAADYTELVTVAARGGVEVPRVHLSATAEPAQPIDVEGIELSTDIRPDSVPGAGSSESDDAASALAWQYSALFALESLQSVVDGDASREVAESIAAHQDMVAMLSALLSDASLAPMAYDVPSVSDAASAVDVAASIEKDAEQLWLHTASLAGTPGWRAACMKFAGAAAVRHMELVSSV